MAERLLVLFMCNFRRDKYEDILRKLAVFLFLAFSRCGILDFAFNGNVTNANYKTNKEQRVYGGKHGAREIIF